MVIASDLLSDLLTKDLIEQIDFPDKTGFMSNIFLRPKRSGGHRLILNLKQLNKHVEYLHFKMDHLPSALALISKGAYFPSLDLSDAYYSVSVAPSHRKYMQFAFNGIIYRFTCLAKVCPLHQGHSQKL